MSETTSTTHHCRRAVTHLWIACRIVQEADLTTDDIELLREVLRELQYIVEVADE